MVRALSCIAVLLAPRSVQAIVRPTGAVEVSAASAGFPLYCHGGGHMKTEILGDAGNTQVDTSFTWASEGAGVRGPAPGECAWADRGPRVGEIEGNHGNHLCDSGRSRFHGIFGAGHATENSGENAALRMAAVVVELPAVQFRYIPGIITDDKYFEFAVDHDDSLGNCLHVIRYVGVMRPPFSPEPAAR